ncbi:MAG TPA: hypothetical protein VK833_01075, partial [Gillisia sp.]|nr:hypothetical protein [Gillisia sp.]
MKILIRTVVALLLFFVFLLILFSIPAVQTSVAKKLTKSIREQSDVDVSVGRVSFSYFGKVKLNEVLVKDHHDDTLLDIQEFRTSILGIPNLIANNPSLGSSTAEGLVFKMKRYKGEDSDNLSILLDKLKTEPTGESKQFKLKVRDMFISDGYYSFIDENNSNPEIIILDKLELQAEYLAVIDQDFSVSINSLQAEEGRGIDIRDLKTDFSYSSTKMKLDSFLLITPYSRLDGSIEMNYTLDDFSDFLNKVNFNASFKESNISTNDLVNFYAPFGSNQNIQLTTELDGTLNNFDLTNLDLKGMDRSRIDGVMNIKGVFSDEMEDFILTGNFNELASNYYDLVNLLPSILKDKLPLTLREFGNLRLTGKTVITKNSLDADVLINTQLGSAKADFVMNNISNSENVNYKGNLVFNQFNIGRLLDNKDLGKTSLNLNIDGSGFTPESLNTQIRGKISRLNFKNYTYSDISILGNVRNSVFNGNFNSNDPNFKLEFNGLVDISKK